MATDRPCPSVLVVGAGSAGLSVAAALQRRGIAPTVLERGDRVGTAWRTRYEELRLNTVRWLSDLPGVSIPRADGRWVTRDEYVAHLEGFAVAHRIDVRFDTTVHRVDRTGDGWQVETDEGSRTADHVVVATGRAHRPRTPDWPGRATYPRPLRHVSELRRAADLAGRSVLVVGGGNSGIDLTVQLVAAGVGSAWLSVRTPPTILPLEIAGLPVQPLGVALRHLPDRLRDAMARGMSRLVVGDLAPYGLPTPPVGAYTRLRTTGVTVAVDRGFARLLRAGRVRVVADVVRLDDDVVLADAGRPRTAPGRPVPGGPGLWFIGYWPAIEGDLRLHPIEARRIARRIAGWPWIRRAGNAERRQHDAPRHPVSRGIATGGAEGI
jgi:putative flavoprotein involved in K+ transport